MLLFISYPNICGCKCGKPERISAQRQKHVREPIQRLDGGTHLPHCCSSTRSQNMSDLVAYVDGGSLGNPGPSGIGLVIDGSADGTIKINKLIGHHDNNVAEYAALLEALQFAVGLGARTLHVFSDSEVVVKQMTGEYTCRSSRLYSLHWTCRKLARSLEFSISHIRRENNAEANRPLAHLLCCGFPPHSYHPSASLPLVLRQINSPSPVPT